MVPEEYRELVERYRLWLLRQETREGGGRSRDAAPPPARPCLAARSSPRGGRSRFPCPGSGPRRPPRGRAGGTARSRSAGARRSGAGAGSWSNPRCRTGDFGRDQRAVVALTALSILALMADGSTDGRGPTARPCAGGSTSSSGWSRSATRDAQWHPGYFHHGKDVSSKMHGQGYATLALATALGSSTGRRYQQIRGVLQKAVACIEQAQTSTGGFGYLPLSAQEHEGSVTVAVAQGLRAARDAGLLVSQDVVDRGLHYLKRSQNPDGSFRYSVHVDRPSYALTAAALSSFFLYGRYGDDPADDIRRGLVLDDDADQQVSGGSSAGTTTGTSTRRGPAGRRTAGTGTPAAAASGPAGTGRSIPISSPASGTPTGRGARRTPSSTSGFRAKI